MALNNVPVSGQNLNNTRDQINQNFALTDAGFSFNHVALGTTGAGKHNLVTMPVQGSDPAISGAQEGALYTKTVSGQPNLFYENLNNGAVTNISTAIITPVPPILGTTGEMVLPSGIKMKWGRGITGGTSLGILTFNFAPPLTNFTTIYTAYAVAATTITPSGDERQVVARVNAYSNSSMSVSTLRIGAAGGQLFNANFTWFAIGV